MPDLETPSAAFAAPSIETVSGLQTVASRYDLLLCDVWGVLHDGVSAFPAAGDALSRYRAGGGMVVLVSNAPRPGEDVTRQLDGLGVSRNSYDAIVTSGDITRAVVAERGMQTLYHLGPERDAGLFEGLTARLGELDQAEYVVCTGLFHDESETVADYGPMLQAMRERDLWMVCANPDIVVERGDRLIACAGALAAAYDAIGGRSFTGGKPHRPIYEAAIAEARKVRGREPDRSRVLAVGDAIRTDVAGGRAFGIDTLLIARGIHAADLGFPDKRLDSHEALAWLMDQTDQPTAIAPELVWQSGCD